MAAHVTITTNSGGNHGVACTCGCKLSGLSRDGADQALVRHQSTHDNGKQGTK